MVDETSPPDGSEKNPLRLIRPTSSAGPIDSIDQLFELLASQRRRFALRHLDTASSAVEFDELVDAVVERERRSMEDYGENHRERVEIELHHVHIPTLIEAGLIDYDRRSRKIQYHHDETIERGLAIGEETGLSD